MGDIFTCLICRAVHLDIVDSLSMDACLNAIERFMAQYGDVTTAFYSDNGTNFRCVGNILQKMYTKNVQQYIRAYVSRHTDCCVDIGLFGVVLVIFLLRDFRHGDKGQYRNATYLFIFFRTGS